MQPSPSGSMPIRPRGELLTDRLVGEDHGPEQVSRPSAAAIPRGGNLATVMVGFVVVGFRRADDPRGGGHDRLVGPDAALHRGGRSRRPAPLAVRLPPLRPGRAAAPPDAAGAPRGVRHRAERRRASPFGSVTTTGSATRWRRGSAPRPCGRRRWPRANGSRFEQQKHTQLLAAAAAGQRQGDRMSFDYKVADLSLAEFGRKEIQLAEHEMPGLMAIAARAARGAAAPGRPDLGLAAHDRADGRADRDPRRPRRRGPLGLVQHLLHPGPRGRGGRRRPGRVAGGADAACRSSPGRARRSRSTGTAPSRCCAGPTAAART